MKTIKKILWEPLEMRWTVQKISSFCIWKSVIKQNTNEEEEVEKKNEEL